MLVFTVCFCVAGDGIDFSVDTSNFVNGREYVLQITVTARYGQSQGILRYTFRFRKQVTNGVYKCVCVYSFTDINASSVHVFFMVNIGVTPGLRNSFCSV